jgi:hypothetical protein
LGERKYMIRRRKKGEVEVGRGFKSETKWE